MNSSLARIILPCSVVKLVKVTSEEPDWIGHKSRAFRVGYYRRTTVWTAFGTWMTVANTQEPSIWK